MNKSRISNVPVLVYSTLLFAIWIASWIAGVTGLISSGAGRYEPLISSRGMRWALRTALESLDAAPWAVAVLSVTALGLLYGSGILKTIYLIIKRKPLSQNRRSAAVIALVLLLMWCVLIFMCSVAPWPILAGIAPGFSSSPLVAGALPLSFVIILTIAIMSGILSGNFRSLSDAINGIGRMFEVFFPALLAFIPASGLLPSFLFVGVGLPEGGFLSAMEFILYMLPFLFCGHSFMNVIRQ